MAVDTITGPDGRRRMRLAIVNPNMPFLVDSVSMELNRHGFTVHRLIHPVLAIAYDEDGEPLSVGVIAVSISNLYALEKLHGLVEKGILSQAEFDAKKAELLKKLT